MRTKGKVSILGTNVLDEYHVSVAACGGYFSNLPDWEDILRRNIDNTAFIAMSFNTAAALDKAGFDGEKAIRELPELVKVISNIEKGCSFPEDDVQRTIRDVARAALDKIRGEHDRS